MACDAKILEDNEDTGSKKFKYVRTVADNYSMAFTYALMALGKMHVPMSPDPLPAVGPLDNLAPGAQVVDDVLLPRVDLVGEDDQEKVPRLDETH